MGSRDSMKVGMYSFDCRDAAALAGFWADVLMRSVDEGATQAFAMIGFEGDGPTWMFHQPTGELAVGDNRLMLDLGGGDDWAEQADRVEALGAERVSDNEQDGVRWVVFRDPEGNTFRIFAPRPR
ncbi:VOC family protein [Streptomyces sp. MP131-18]|uniref:VOC family protein n=1 Tax=Streptomyces sp. MP131-18 TaxID=1857892 RepID=UPI0009A21AC9|nr:VOC family protein [Streptomyces sp. MP131-18]ONK15450.1 Glyoxalase-like domain protein [Streptomyces sp. MP131-18]